MHGPYMVAAATNASQPDWFLFWVEGALRLYPGFEWRVAGTVVSGVFVVGIVLPLLIGALLFGYPAIERAVTGGDARGHHAVQSPLEAPFRLGFVAGLVTFFLVLTTAAGHDVIARLLQTSVESVTWALRVLVLAGPVAVGVGFARYARWRGEAR